MNDKYILVFWPEVQDLMEEEWFRYEAILNPDEDSAYFIPESRIGNSNAYILTEIERLALQLEHTQAEADYIESEWNESVPFEGNMNTFESVLNLKLSLPRVKGQSKI
ncbi:MAG: hypothetical protein ACOH2V_01060 [Candidatus Saccharimonadaceae bacterium]